MAIKRVQLQTKNIQPEALNNGVTLYPGDCLVALDQMEENFIDSCVTDPPYHLFAPNKRTKPSDKLKDKGLAGAAARMARGFMGQKWDGGDIAFRADTWRKVHRTLKPGAYLLAFCGTRTYHRMATAIEDAGFEVRDCIQWIYSTGFPKSLDVGDGWGTALNPAAELICVARKPLSEKTVEANIQKWGTGAINVDGCRVGSDFVMRTDGSFIQGRWPSNVTHDGSDYVVKALGQASRFFYSPKAGGDERGIGDTHPTLKPVGLTRWLIRLVTRKGGVVLDLFAGSGTAGEAAILEGMKAVLVERETEYQQIIRDRIATAKEPFRRRVKIANTKAARNTDKLDLFVRTPE